MKFSRPSNLTLTAWLLFVGGYAGILAFMHASSQTEGRDLIECLVPLFANACLLSNAASSYHRRNAFWKLLALGCTLLLVGTLIRTYHELVLHRSGPATFPGSVFPFLHMIPVMAALALMPHARKMREILRHGYLDLLILATVWIYLYVFTAMPWQMVWPDPRLFHQWNVTAFVIQNLVVITGFGILCARTSGGWRIIYGHILGAATLYAGGFLLAVAIGGRAQAPIKGLSYVASMVWLGLAGVVARRLSPAPQPAPAFRRDTQWQVRVSMLMVLSFPVLAGWAVFLGSAPAPVRTFRLIATLVGAFVGSVLVFFRQHLVLQERTGLVSQLSKSLDNVQRLQTQFVQSEKLASLGQLAAGAAHEINNPLTAILGYTDLLLGEHPPKTRAHSLAQKIQEQARRTKILLNNLLSFARQVPAEKQLLDLSVLLDSAVQLRKLDLHGKSIRIDLESRSVLPAVRGDPNQLLQVFYQLIGNAMDAMETVGGLLLIHAFAESGMVVIEFSDTGPGMKDPGKVFDPFYTTKPMGKGTGLGLSICYGIMQEHSGTITGFNRPEGGCTFRLEFPAVLASLPRASMAPVSDRDA